MFKSNKNRLIATIVFLVVAFGGGFYAYTTYLHNDGQVAGVREVKEKNDDKEKKNNGKDNQVPPS